MAKAKKHSCVAGISALTKAIRAEASGTLTAEERAKVVSDAMDIVDNSNFIAVAENTDAAIELQDRIEAEAAAENLAPPAIEQEKQSF